jgi:hypothetical protein
MAMNMQMSEYDSSMQSSFSRSTDSELISLASIADTVTRDAEKYLAAELRKRKLPIPSHLEGLAEIDPDNQPGLLTSAWKGEAPLWKVWWLIGVPLNIGFKILGGIITWASQSSSPAFSLLLGIAMVLVAIVWCKMAWVCSKNVQNRIWTHLARAMIIISWISSGVALW